MTEAPQRRANYDSTLLRRLIGYLQPYRGPAALSVVLLVAHSALGVVGPFLTKVAVDRSLRPVQQGTTFFSEFLPLDRIDALLVLTGLYMAVLAVSYFLRAGQIQIMNETGQRVMYDMRQQVFGHLQAKSVAYFDRNAIGRLVTRVTTDVDALNEVAEFDPTYLDQEHHVAHEGALRPGA